MEERFDRRKGYHLIGRVMLLFSVSSLLLVGMTGIVLFSQQQMLSGEIVRLLEVPKENQRLILEILKEHSAMKSELSALELKNSGAKGHR